MVQELNVVGSDLIANRILFFSFYKDWCFIYVNICIYLRNSLNMPLTRTVPISTLVLFSFPFHHLCHQSPN